MANYVFWDLETTSGNVYWGQIIEAAAILVNDDFQELDRYEGRCRLSPGTIPEPKSKTSPPGTYLVISIYLD